MTPENHSEPSVIAIAEGTPAPSPLPPAPAFGQRSIAEVLTSAAASLGIDGL